MYLYTPPHTHGRHKTQDGERLVCDGTAGCRLCETLQAVLAQVIGDVS
jgi:hypothetical protein